MDRGPLPTWVHSPLWVQILYFMRAEPQAERSAFVLLTLPLGLCNKEGNMFIIATLLHSTLCALCHLLMGDRIYV